MLLSPPLAITRQEKIDEIVSKAKKAVGATAQQLGWPIRGNAGTRMPWCVRCGSDRR
jgi:hypothetical protein